MSSPVPFVGEARPLVEVVRGALVESVHLGHLVILDGHPETSVGPAPEIYARSALKPLQAVAMLECGLPIDDEGLALACASHSGEPRHLEVARRILAGVGLTEDDLQNTPDRPYGEQARAAWAAAGRAPSPLAQNCSGKHAAMLATCVANGWPTASYRSPDHPLQQAVAATLTRLTGAAPQYQSVDGCGAPLFSCRLDGLARAFAAIAGAAAGTDHPAAQAGAVAGAAAANLDASCARVGQAMTGHPDLVGGTDRDVSILMAGVPGLVAKDGAEAVYAVGLPDGRAVALKILDGGQRARPVAMAAALRSLGVSSPALDVLAHAPVLGHGQPVGHLRAVVTPSNAAPPNGQGSGQRRVTTDPNRGTE